MDTSKQAGQSVRNGFSGRIYVHGMEIVVAHDNRCLVACYGLNLCVREMENLHVKSVEIRFSEAKEANDEH